MICWCVFCCSQPINIAEAQNGEKALDMTIKTGRSRKALWMLESLIIVLALFAKSEVIPGDGSENVLIAFIAKIRDSFGSSGITGLIFFVLF